MVLVDGYVCFGTLAGDVVTIKISRLRKTRYLPLVTFFIRFLLLHSDQVEFLVGAVLASGTKISLCYSMVLPGPTLNISLHSTDQLDSCRWRVPFILLIASGIVSLHSRSPLAQLTICK